MMTIEIPDNVVAPASPTSWRGKVVVPCQGHFSFTCTNQLLLYYLQEEVIAPRCEHGNFAVSNDLISNKFYPPYKSIYCPLPHFM